MPGSQGSKKLDLLAEFELFHISTRLQSAVFIGCGEFVLTVILTSDILRCSFCK